MLVEDDSVVLHLYPAANVAYLTYSEAQYSIVYSQRIILYVFRLLNANRSSKLFYFVFSGQNLVSAQSVLG